MGECRQTFREGGNARARSPPPPHTPPFPCVSVFIESRCCLKEKQLQRFMCLVSFIPFVRLPT